MVFSYLNKSNIFDKYSGAHDTHEKLTKPFPEWARIAQAKPLASIPAEYPKTTDGTTAAIIRKTGRRVVQQLPTGVIDTDNDNDWLPIVAEFILNEKIIPFANKDYDLIQKCWNTIENGLTFGSQAVYTPFLKQDKDFSTDYQLVYWGDIFLQPGKKSAYDSEYIFMREWYQKDDIKAIIDAEGKRAKAAKKNGEPYESSWDVSALKEVLDKATAKDELAKTPTDEDRQVNEEAIELITGFQKGVGAKFITFNPGTKTVVRTKTNKDPRGKIPIDFFYADIDGTNPLGRGVVELIGGLQNLIDSDMQMYQYNRALMLAPPIIKRGNFNKNKIVFRPNAIIDLGSDQNAQVEALKVDTSAVTNYPNLYGLQKSQLLNLVSSPDTSISAEVGNPGFSKTHAGVQQQNAIISVDDNFLRKMFEAFWENKCETDINRYFAEREGVEELQLDKKTADRLRKLVDDGKLDPQFISENDTILIDYSQATEALKFSVDASTSKVKTDQEQLEALDMIRERITTDPLLSQYFQSNMDKYLAIYNAQVRASGIEDPELAIIDIEEFKKQQEAAAQEQMAMMQQQQAAEEQQAMEQQAIPAEIVEEEPEIDSGLIDDLRADGHDDETIAEVIDMLDKGYGADQIVGALQLKEQEAVNV